MIRSLILLILSAGVLAGVVLYSAGFFHRSWRPERSRAVDENAVGIVSRFHLWR